MTLSTAIPRVSYAGNGATTSFAFSFKVFAAADLKVYLRDNVSLQDTLQVLTTNYTVSGTFPGTGNVVFGVAPPSGKTVIILRDPAVDQALDLIASGSFAAENVETALDKLASYVQSLAQRATWLEGNVTVDFASIASGALSAAQNITVTGAAIGDPVQISASTDLAGLLPVGYVSAADTVTFRLINLTGGAIDPASRTYFARVEKRI